MTDAKDNERLLDDGDVITEDIIEILSKRQDRFTDCFVKYKDKRTCHFEVILPCEKCGKMAMKQWAKTTLREYLFGKRFRHKFLCEDCEQAKNNNEKKQKAINEVEAEKEVERYISYYLNPNNAWKEGTSQYEKENLVENVGFDNQIRDYINQMEYKDFLQTPYWKAIAGKIRRKADYKCQMCGKKTTLSVHHRSYEYHGLEHTWNGQRELIAICQDCHDKFHSE